MNEISHDTIAMVTLANGEVISMPEGKYRLIYNDAGQVISLLSGKYNPLTNAQIEGYFSRPINEGLVKVVNKGTLQSGARYYLQMELPKMVRIANKEVKGLLTALDCRTGNNAFALAITPVFIVCGNTWATANSAASLRIGHFADESQIIENVIQITEEFTQGIGHSLSELYDALGKVKDDPRAFLERVYAKELAKNPESDISDLKDYTLFMDLYESEEANSAADVTDAVGLQRSVGIYTYMVSNKLKPRNAIDLVSTNYARGNKLRKMEQAIGQLLATA